MFNVVGTLNVNGPVKASTKAFEGSGSLTFGIDAMPIQAVWTD